MLELNEKKIRKGRPLGLPYQGSKKKISKKIVEIIKQNFGTDKPIYDIFGGGGAITAECLLNGLEVHYNDLDETATSMFQKVVSEDRDYLKTLIVSRDEFFKILDKENKTIDDELKLLINSFGYDRKTYLYSKEFSDLKYNLAIEIIKNHDVFDGYKKTDTYKNAYRPFDIGKVDRAQVLEQLQRLHQLQRLQQLECVEVTNLDYTEFSGIEDTILYLDPPYQNTLLKGYSINEFNSQSFYGWAYEMSKKNIVLISSYEISDERFECVYEFKNVRSTYAPGPRGKQTEKLFMVKKGKK
ncbi:DNA adenine methylase [Streptococcus alactolyticus]|uniref:DNA adenine methylase n=1 Tax=Streptococcus alactolyticus TaxID=29389 RepID=UPI001959466E|nr:DNA adenine methylase [Streptococcus alactolyticus]MBM6697520.1 DNA adenine methylase [Streptococcus alactolyticus]